MDDLVDEIRGYTADKGSVQLLLTGLEKDVFILKGYFLDSIEMQGFEEGGESDFLIILEVLVY